MEWSLRRWKPSQLLLGWAAYWVGLIGVTLGPAIRASWRATRLPDNHGTITASFDNGALSYSVIEEGVKTWSGSVPFSTVMLWLVGPPLLLWVVWLIVRQRTSAPRVDVSAGKASVNALRPGDAPAADWVVDRDERVRVERDRITTPNP